MKYAADLDSSINISQDHYDFVKFVERYKLKYLITWWETKTTFPDFGIKYNKKEKQFKEKESNQFIKELKEFLENSMRKKEIPEIDRDKIISLSKTNLKNLFGMSDEHFNALLNKNFPDITNAFVKQARKFKQDINVYEIYQAVRNVWIMNSLQILLNKPVELTSSIFAYSMLYPYTDNYLDDPGLSLQDKSEFNARFRRRLSGENVLPLNKREEDIFSLVSMIEGQYSRMQFPDVFESLLTIHSAQEKSLVQQNKNISPYENDILGISFEKGGASVLADGYLIKGNLTIEESDFLFGFGVFLQLIDDLSDIEENRKNGQMTIFSQTAFIWPLDKLTNRLFRFMTEIIKSLNCFYSSDTMDFSELIQKSCTYLIIDAVAKYNKMFSKEYIREINEYSNLRFSYRTKFRKKMKKLFLDNYKEHNLNIKL